MPETTSTTKVLVKLEVWVEVASYGEDWRVGDMVKQSRRLAEDRMRCVLSNAKAQDIVLAKITSHQVISTEQK